MSECASDSKAPVVLVANDLPGMRTALARLVRRAGMVSVEASDGRQASELFGRIHFDCVVTDQEMPEMDGLGLIREIRETGSRCPIILFTGLATHEIEEEATRLGADQVISAESTNALLIAVERVGELCRGSA